VRVIDSFIPIVTLDGVTLTEATRDAVVTVTVTVDVNPFGALAVIVAVPVLMPVTSPVAELTVATAVFEDSHVTVLFAAFSGRTVAVSCIVLGTPALVLAEPIPIIGFV